ncbi:MAG: cation:dicarboxylase symporter family transporter [Simkaniaceae bacterium]|nr:cation:dicarboxylase symporter family transporter [Candidatus Sacchlamyda saccharinae]
MAIATLLGICVGLFFGERCSALEPYASAYVMILKVTAIPYLIVAIIHGVGLLSRAQGMQILKKGSLFIGLALLINIGVIYLIKWEFPIADGPKHIGYVSRDVPDLNFAEILIPHNIFYDLAHGIIPAVVIFSLLVGISLMQLAEKQTTMSGLQTLLESLTKVTSWIARITPIGTFLIMANQVGTVHFATIKQMSTYVILFVLGTSLVTFWILPRIASFLTPVKALAWVRGLIPVLVLVYTTTLTIVALPYIINIIKREVQMLYPKDENVQTQIQGTVSIIFNLPIGSIFTAAFVFFISIFFSTKLGALDQVKLLFTTFLTSLGAVGLGSWINSLTFILDALGLPIDAVSMYLAIVPFTAGFQAMLSAMLIATLAFLIMLAGRGLLQTNWKKITFGSLLTLIPILVIFGGLKYFDPLPQIRNENKTIFDLEIESDATVRIFTKENIGEIPAAPPEGPTLQRIFNTKKLRVGYDSHAAPFCFWNKHGKLVGYDVAYAYQLAYDLGCDQLDFIPIEQSTLGAQLNNNAFDIAMSAISISNERLKKMCFPQQLLEAKIVFVTKDKHRKKFAQIDNIRADRNLKIAAVVNTAYEGIAYEEFPHHEIILLDSYAEFAVKNPPADILIWEEQEAMAWTVSNPLFHVVQPKPTLGKETLGYPIKFNDPEFLCYLNSWLTLKENDGFKEDQYKLWIMGQTAAAAPSERRWSFLDNVLEWGQSAE